LIHKPPGPIYAYAHTTFAAWLSLDAKGRYCAIIGSATNRIAFDAVESSDSCDSGNVLELE
jgi:hypothetical protein